MKTLTVLTLIALNLMTAKAQPSHPNSGDGRMHTSIAGETEGHTNVSELVKISTLNIYPNPAVRNLYAEFNSGIATHATLKVIDFIGKNIVTESIDLVEGINKVTIELNELESGIYFLKIEDGNGVKLCQRFTKQ